MLLTGATRSSCGNGLSRGHEQTGTDRTGHSNHDHMTKSKIALQTLLFCCKSRLMNICHHIDFVFLIVQVFHSESVGYCEEKCWRGGVCGKGQKDKGLEGKEGGCGWQSKVEARKQKEVGGQARFIGGEER